MVGDIRSITILGPDVLYHDGPFSRENRSAFAYTLSGMLKTAGFATVVYHGERGRIGVRELQAAAQENGSPEGQAETADAVLVGGVLLSEGAVRDISMWRKVMPFRAYELPLRGGPVPVLGYSSVDDRLQSRVFPIGSFRMVDQILTEPADFIESINTAIQTVRQSE